MVELNAGIEQLPPAERIRRLRAIESEKQQSLEGELVKKKKELEDELAKKKKELEKIEKQTKEELEDAKAAEKRALRDAGEEVLQRQKELKELEARINEFRESGQFITQQPATPAIVYHNQPRAMPEKPPEVGKAQQGIDYLLNANTTNERRLDQERELYQTVRQMADHPQRSIDEGYAVQQLQDQIQQLRQRGEDSHGYIRRIASVLNEIVDYKQERKRDQH